MDLNDFRHFVKFNSLTLCVIITIEALFFLWSGVCINLSIDEGNSSKRNLNVNEQINQKSNEKQDAQKNKNQSSHQY